jgi:cytochrome c553
VPTYNRGLPEFEAALLIMKKLFLSLSILLCASTLAPVALAQNAQAGEKKAAMCLGCHNIPGYQASFPQVHKVPMISGQNAKYIEAALAAYKKGERIHPTMKAIAATLSTQDMADLGAFYQQQAKDVQPPPAQATPAPSPEVAALLTRNPASACATCHGANFSKPLDGSIPKLAGQHADYLYVALKAYQTEKNPQVGRNNAIMSGIAKQYTPAELKLIAEYLNSLPGEMRVAPQSRFR